MNLLTCAALLAAQLTLLPNAANADVTVTGAEVGGSVVLSYSGSVDLTGLIPNGTASIPTLIIPTIGAFYSNPSISIAGEYLFAPYFTPFGGGGAALPTSASGDVFAVNPFSGYLYLPSGYVSGDSLAGSLTFAGATFASLGLGSGTYTNAISPNFNFIITFGPPPEEVSAVTTGLPMANVQGQMLISAGSTVTNDLNNHLFNLQAGDGEEDATDSVAALADYGVVVGQGDGNPDAKNPIAKMVPRSRQWEVFTTVNYGNVKLNAINNQAGVQVDSWAPSVGISRHLSRGLAVGFATTFLTSDQSYTSGLGNLHLEGPALSAYVSFARKN